MKIGNIVSNTDLNVGNEFNVVDSLDNIIKGIPTLIVGYSIVKEIFGDELDFIERKIGDIFWTFTKDEQKKYHTPDFNEFINYCFNKKITDTTYIFIDPIQFSKSKIKKIINKIKSIDNIITYLNKKNILYLFGDNLIFGIDLNLIKFIGIDDIKIKKKLKVISKTFLEGDEILIEYNEYLERLNNQTMYIPLLYSIKKNE